MVSTSKTCTWRIIKFNIKIQSLHIGSKMKQVKLINCFGLWHNNRGNNYSKSLIKTGNETTTSKWDVP